MEGKILEATKLLFQVATEAANWSSHRFEGLVKAVEAYSALETDWLYENAALIVMFTQEA